MTLNIVFFLTLAREISLSNGRKSQHKTEQIKSNQKIKHWGYLFGSNLAKKKMFVEKKRNQVKDYFYFTNKVEMKIKHRFFLVRNDVYE